MSSQRKDLASDRPLFCRLPSCGGELDERTTQPAMGKTCAADDRRSEVGEPARMEGLRELDERGAGLAVAGMGRNAEDLVRLAPQALFES